MRRRLRFGPLRALRPCSPPGARFEARLVAPLPSLSLYLRGAQSAQPGSHHGSGHGGPRAAAAASPPGRAGGALRRYGLGHEVGEWGWAGPAGRGEGAEGRPGCPEAGSGPGRHLGPPLPFSSSLISSALSHGSLAAPPCGPSPGGGAVPLPSSAALPPSRGSTGRALGGAAPHGDPPAAPPGLWGLGQGEMGLTLGCASPSTAVRATPAVGGAGRGCLGELRPARGAPSFSRRFCDKRHETRASAANVSAPIRRWSSGCIRV